MNTSKSLLILLVDDDEEDCEMTREAFEEVRFRNELRILNDGEELMNYLLRREEFSDPDTAPRPGLILLDLNMPRKDGREALVEIKQHPELREIPIVVLTTSREEEDIIASYQTGANSFIAKPVTFEGLVAAVQSLGRYWFELVELPRESRD